MTVIFFFSSQHSCVACYYSHTDTQNPQIRRGFQENNFDFPLHAYNVQSYMSRILITQALSILLHSLLSGLRSRACTYLTYLDTKHVTKYYYFYKYRHNGPIYNPCRNVQVYLNGCQRFSRAFPTLSIHKIAPCYLSMPVCWSHGRISA